MTKTSSLPSTRALRPTEVLARFRKLAEEDLFHSQCSIHVQTGIQGLSWNISFVNGQFLSGQNPDEVAEIFASRSSIGITYCKIQRAQGNQVQPPISIAYQCTDGLLATVFVDPSSANPAMVLQAFDLAAKHFDLSPVSEIVVNNDGSWHEVILNYRQTTIAEFTAAQQKLIAAAAEFTTQDAERRRIAEVQLEERYREREAELVKQSDERRAELDKRQAALAEKEGEYLSRNAQLARREEQRRLEEMLKEMRGQEVSASVNAKRRLTLYSIIALAVVAGCLAGFTGWHLFSAETLEWRFAVPFASSMFVVWLTLTYFIQWNDRWAREHSDAEFLSNRYRVDALRAQWLAEWVSEAAEGGKNVALPPELIAAFSRNLFGTQVGDGAPRHGLERLIDQPKRMEVGKTVVQIGAEK